MYLTYRFALYVCVLRDLRSVLFGSNFAQRIGFVPDMHNWNIFWKTGRQRFANFCIRRLVKRLVFAQHIVHKQHRIGTFNMPPCAINANALYFIGFLFFA